MGRLHRLWMEAPVNPLRPLLDRLEDLSETQFAYLMLVPLFVLVGTMAFWPLVRTFQISLHADSVVSSTGFGEFIGVKNYVDILTGKRDAFLPNPFLDLNNPFSSALTVTLVFTVAAVTLETVIGFGQALVLNKSFRGRRWVRVALIIPWAVPIVIQGMIFFLLFNPSIGFLVEPFFNAGIFSQSPLATASDTLVVVILADVWRQSAFMTLLILAGLQSIDRDLYNVSRISGATRWQQFKTITFPLVLPALMVALLFRTLGAMKVFGTIQTVSTCTTLPSLTCLVVATFNDGRIGSAATIAFITAALIGVVLLVYLVVLLRSDTGEGGL